MAPIRRILPAILAGLFAFPAPAAVPTPFTYGPRAFVNFETPHVHPIEMTPDGARLLAVNTAEGSLMVFDLGSGKPVLARTVMVGTDPVSVRARTATEAWVVNRVSNSISVVDVRSGAVLDSFEPCRAPGDVVFAGASGETAVVSCTRPNLLVGVDAASHAIRSSVTVAGESPRALALSPDRRTVYAAIFESGNTTTVLVGDTKAARIKNAVEDPDGPYGGRSPIPNKGTLYSPPRNLAAGTPPPVSAIVYKTGDGIFQDKVACSNAVFGDPIRGVVKACEVQDPATGSWAFCAREGQTCTFTGRRKVRYGANDVYSSGKWTDDAKGDWTAMVTGNLASHSNRVTGWDLVDRDVAVYDTVTGRVSYQTHLMSTVMGIAVNPATAEVTAIGTDATNEIRFEPVLNGVFLKVEFARFVPGRAPAIVDLNPHIDYAAASTTDTGRALSIGDPRGIAWTAAGDRGFITGMGSNSLVAVDRTGQRIATATVGQGPTGVVYDESRRQGYVLNKFDGTITVFASDLSIRSTVAFFDPTSSAIKAGRPFLYDTHIGSGNGQISCASCHVDARTDRLAWDLGNPAGDLETRNGFTFHPMKGPMKTQPLQNIIGSPSLHHRGDRDDLFGFAGAFKTLQGRDAAMDAASMARFEAFLAEVAFPPNPNRHLDNGFGKAVAIPGPLNTVTAFADATRGFCGFSCHQGSRGRSDVRGTNELHLSQPAAPTSLQGLADRIGLFWTTREGSTSGTGLRTNGAHQSVSDSPLNDFAFMLSFEGPSDRYTDRSANAHAGIGAQVFLKGALGRSPDAWCAGEGGVCRFQGTRTVRYGAAGKYATGTFTDTVNCRNTVFGDPVPGVVKACWLVDAGAAVRPPVSSLPVCAQEGAVCTVDRLTEVVYGTPTGPVRTLIVRNNVPCSNATFGDPQVGVVKSCYLREPTPGAAVSVLIDIAETGKVGLVYTGLAGGKPVGGYYTGAGRFQTDRIGRTASAAEIFDLARAGASIQFMLVPRGSEYRIGADADLDGRLNGDELAARADPRRAASGSWSGCASEGQACNVTGPAAVRFGVPGAYAYLVGTDAVACTVQSFGDPAPGKAKACSLAR